MSGISAKDMRIRPLEYTDKVDIYMDAADLLFTKPGGLTSTEAAVKGYDCTHKPIPGCEERMRNSFWSMVSPFLIQMPMPWSAKGLSCYMMPQ